MLSTAEKAWTGSEDCFTAEEASGTQETWSNWNVAGTLGLSPAYLQKVPLSGLKTLRFVLLLT